MKLSFVLPSLFPELIDGAIEAAHAAAADIDHEIVVVSPHETSREGVRWVPETSPRGSIAACNLGFAAATGDVIALIADDNRLTPGAVRLAMAHLAAREGATPALLLGFPRQSGPMTFVGSVYGRYYPYFFLARRTTLDRVGGGFDEGYRKHYADPDLGQRVWAAGGRCEVVRGAVIVDVDSRAGAGQAPDKALGSQASDFARFAAIWGGRHPGWGDAEGGINLDVGAEFLPLLGTPDTVAVEDRARILDLRVLSALTTLALHHGVPVGMGRAVQALEYLRWLAGVAPDVLNIVVSGGNRAGLARP
jgi:glycosyltransferase involved in cell wall biosynthesis